jgi:prepilin-type N-terminal cleavage/methylation domain-containing protein
MRRAFTMIELLVVITIIALLASLTIVMVSTVKFSAMKLVTMQRMEAVTKGLSEVGQQEGSAAYMLQKQVISQDPWTPYAGSPPQSGFPRFEGVVAFDTTGVFNTSFGTTTVFDAFPAANLGQWFMEAAQPTTAYVTGTATTDMDDHLFNFPWGKAPFPLVLPSTGGTFTPSTVPLTPEHHVLRNLCPYQTINLLHAANVLNDEPYTDPTNSGQYTSGDNYVDLAQSGHYEYMRDLYTTDRAQREPWNDKWGNPLVVAYALFQPPTVMPIPSAPSAQTTPPYEFGTNAYLNPNPFQTQALQVYQYARSIYISVAASGTYARLNNAQTLTSTSMTDWMMTYPGAMPGAQLPLTWAESWSNSLYATQPGTNMFVIWKQANQICQQDQTSDPAGMTELHAFNETGFDNPPWQGIKWGKRTVGSHLENCFLSAPLELK